MERPFLARFEIAATPVTRRRKIQYALVISVLLTVAAIAARLSGPPGRLFLYAKLRAAAPEADEEEVCCCSAEETVPYICIFPSDDRVYSPMHPLGPDKPSSLLLPTRRRTPKAQPRKVPHYDRDATQNAPPQRVPLPKRNATFPVLRVDTHTLAVRTRVANACNSTTEELPIGGTPVWEEHTLSFLAQQEAYDVKWADYTVDVEA